MQTLAQTFRTARKQSGLTQAKLAKKCGFPSSQYVSNWERGVATPPLTTLPKLCRILGVDAKKVAALLLNNYKNEVNAAFKH